MASTDLPVEVRLFCVFGCYLSIAVYLYEIYEQINVCVVTAAALNGVYSVIAAFIVLKFFRCWLEEAVKKCSWNMWCIYLIPLKYVIQLVQRFSPSM